MTQCERIMKYIEDFGSITTFEAFSELGITRLGSRIHDLKNQGVNFERETITKKNRYNEPIHFTRYSFKEERA